LFREVARRVQTPRHLLLEGVEGADLREAVIGKVRHEAGAREGLEMERDGRANGDKLHDVIPEEVQGAATGGRFVMFTSTVTLRTVPAGRGRRGEEGRAVDVVFTAPVVP